MKIKAVFNESDERQASYIRYIRRVFPELISEENPDMFFVIGGDGAMLHAHKQYGHLGKPFFGKGFGSLNFIMNNFDNDFEVIEGLLADEIVPTIIKSEKIKVKIIKSSGEKIIEECINDVVIGNNIMDYHHFKMDSERGAFVDFGFKGMGICVSTPLGSTAFNLNNGGKVIPLDSKLWSITSIVGDHNVNEIMKPQKLAIEILSERHIPSIFIDGVASSYELGKGDVIKLEKCKHKFKLAFIDPKSFFKRRMKLVQKKR